MAIKYIVGSVLLGIVLATRSFSIPAAALPSFGFIFLVYGALIAWELRKLLPAYQAHSAPRRPQVVYTTSHATGRRLSDPVFNRVKTA